jgi:hypothetical protein
MADEVAELQLFVEIVKAGNLSAAARALNRKPTSSPSRRPLDHYPGSPGDAPFASPTPRSRPYRGCSSEWWYADAA